jgi:CPA1 family monovalent cation:H+ antiporter
VYGPAFTALSAAGTAVAGESRLATRLFFQGTAALSVLAAVFILGLRSRQGSAPAFLGLNPVVIVSVVGDGHNDALVGLAVLAAVLVVVRRPVVGGFLLGVAAAISGVVIAMRIVWVMTVPYILRAVDRRESQVARRTPWRTRMVLAWSGMRGAVSLAAALALPESTPQRDLIVFVTFSVILATLVLQGLTLPTVIRRLHVHGDDGDAREELRARLVATQAALTRLEELTGEEWTRDDTVERMTNLYDYRRRRLKARAGKIEDDGYEDRSQAYQRTVREVLEAQRAAVVALRNDGTISNDVMHRIERELDLEDQRLEI